VIEIEYEDKIDAGTIAVFGPDKLEEYIEDRISNGIFERIQEHLEEMAFIDIEPTEDNGFRITAELVLCAKQQIISTSEMQAVKLANYGLTEDQIFDVLNTQLEETKGF